MATSAVLSLTNANGDTFSIEASSVIYAYDNASTKAVLTYATAKGINAAPVTLTISTAALVALSTNILWSYGVIEGDGSTKTVCFNNANIIKLSDTADSNCLMSYFVNNAPVPQPFILDDAALDVATATAPAKVAVAVTDNVSGTVYYINGFRAGNIEPNTTEQAIELETATVVARGTVMVAGTTLLTLVGGTKTVAATALVTHTEVATRTMVSGGTGYTAGDVVTGVSGTGTKFTISIDTVNGSGVATATTLVTRGNYTANPTLTASTVTGGTGTGATFTVVMGAKTLAPATLGVYTVAPTGTITTTGGGNDATLTATFAEGSITGCTIFYNDETSNNPSQLNVDETKAVVVAAINAL